jgi:N6-adenosine-specific RNA methylase IME4
MAAYRVLCADPPWLTQSLPMGSADRHYAQMTTERICDFELPPLADDCYLFLWRVACMVPDAYRVAKAWGFTGKAEIVWIKKTSKGNRWFGLGYHTRAEHEIAILATKGKPKPKVHNIRSCFEAQHTGRHSGKPEEFYDLVERLCDGPYVELFARRQRPGWTCIGELEGSK